jgi:hypothetical protein
MGMAGPSSAWNAVHRWLGEYARQPMEQARDIALAHLDQLTLRAWETVEQPGPVVSSGKLVTGSDGRPVANTRVAIEALRLLVAIDQRRARLLGLDAPKRQTISVIRTTSLIKKSRGCRRVGREGSRAR